MSTLNNSAAYGFSANVARPCIISVLKNALDAKCKVEASMSISDKLKPITIKVQQGRSKKDLSVVIKYDDRDTIALSMYNMMYAKNVTFIANDTVYVVSGDILRANWSSIMSKMHRYTDGSSVRTEMTYADVAKVTALADESYPIPEGFAPYVKYKDEMKKLMTGGK